jgi:hypothetical protein
MFLFIFIQKLIKNEKTKMNTEIFLKGLRTSTNNNIILKLSNFNTLNQIEKLFNLKFH